jgi:hypothetical protein
VKKKVEIIAVMENRDDELSDDELSDDEKTRMGFKEDNFQFLERGSNKNDNN